MPENIKKFKPQINQMKRSRQELSKQIPETGRSVRQGFFSFLSPQRRVLQAKRMITFGVAAEAKQVGGGTTVPLPFHL